MPDDPIRTVLAVPDAARGGSCSGVIFVYRHRGPAASRTSQIAAAGDLRRPGRHRHRERPPAPRSSRRRNRDLTEALEQQTATSEILRVISSSPTDVQPVFNTIVVNAVRLCNARMGRRRTGSMASWCTWSLITTIRRKYSRSSNACIRGRRSLTRPAGRAILTRAVAQIEDMLADPQYRQEIAVAGGWRSIIAVPDAPRGRAHRGNRHHQKRSRSLPRRADRPPQDFRRSGRHRHRERPPLQGAGGRNRDLTEALEQQTATSEILRAISSAQTDASPCSRRSSGTRFDCVTASTAAVLVRRRVDPRAGHAQRVSRSASRPSRKGTRCGRTSGGARSRGSS